MIIDLLFINCILWSGVWGYSKKYQKFMIKGMSFLIAILIAILSFDRITIIKHEKITETLSQKDYVIKVFEEPVKDYLLVRKIVEELPVTTEIQNRLVKEYYKENTNFIVEELIIIISKIIGQLLNMLIIFTLIILILQVISSLLLYNKKIEVNDNKKLLACLMNIILNFIFMAVVIIILNWLSYFFVDKLPEINLENSIFRPMIYKIIDIIINIV
ncbi:hypothetical protein SAMN02745227_00637 [Anaerobranca californiensis DSM 14826]|jgi:hypothetical protein|uniref:Uncharacterized protein n=1 Tax=Anaerobranca californiensis DSM 14826 TaxID=1120989 RepID=A0A1M6M3N4_9FIRM|nr:hypothetical protein [Anaerobranca californiensis]SHJ77973.1 hypothetical protein SAMN02745227_00637 [Anaerobranca californiensis DSM 14826]